MPSSEVYEILQDRQGYIWFCTDNGVSRYNGYKFENFGALQGLTESVVFHLIEDIKGRIWMQCMSGRMFYFEKDSIYSFLGNKFIEGLKNKQFAKGIYIDSFGQVFNAIYPNGLFRFSSNGAGEQIIDDKGFNVYQIENKALPVSIFNHQDQNGTKELLAQWKNQSQIDVAIFNKKKAFNYKLPFTSLNEVNFELILLHDHTLLIQICGYLFCFRKDKLIWQMLYPDRIAAWFENSMGEIFLGLEHKGIRHYHRLTDIPEEIYETQLEGYTISHILEDQDGGYWFAALENGVFYCSNPDIKIYDIQTGFPSAYVTSLALKNNKNVFIGFLDGNILELDATNNKITHLNHGGTKIHDLVYDSFKNTLWVCTPNLMNYYNGVWQPMINTHNPNKANYIAKHFRLSSSKRELWATYTYGFIKIDPDSKSVVFHSDEIIEDHTRYVRRTNDVLTSSMNRTWVVNNDGLFEFKNKQLNLPEKRHPAFQNRIQAIEELSDSTLVLGSKGFGLLLWKDDSIASITEAGGLAANMIENLHVDVHNNIWVGSRNGLNKIQWNWDGKYKLETINIGHGLPSNEITDIASWNKEIWIGTTKGVAHLSNHRVKRVSSNPLLASVFVNKRLVDSVDLTQLLHWENNLTINYFTFNYKMNGHIPYRYRMNNSEWVQTFNTSLNFLSMTPGTWAFEVQAQNEDGVWSESSTIAFVINPPWWLTWWAKTLYTLTALTLGLSIYRYKTGKLKQEHQIQLKISELERSALQAQMNPHFIFNCLNSIQNYILQNDKDSAIKYLGSFASLVRSMLNASVVGKISLEEEIKLLNNYLDLEKIRFKNRFTYEVKTAETLDTFEIMIPPLLVQPYVENAVKHGIETRESGGKILVYFEKKDNVLVVSILDNGTGTLPDRHNLENQNRHKSFGMSITQNRLELLSNDNLNNTVRSKTLYDQNNHISGTEVIIRIGLTEELQTT